jgi:hypothetical protein
VAALTAATVRRDWLEPALEVLAHLDMAVGHARHLTGAADRTVTDLHRLERVDRQPAGVPAAQIARDLRAPLDVLQEAPHVHLALVPIVHALLTIPRTQLLTPTVERKLNPRGTAAGQRRFAVLLALVEAVHETEGGARDGTPDAATDGIVARGTPGS